MASIGGLVSLGQVKKNKIMGGEEIPLTIDEAKERAKAILENDLGLDKATANQIVDDGTIRELGGEGTFFDVENDKRLKADSCTPDTCQIKTQLFAIHVDDDKSGDLATTYNNKPSKWVSYDSVGDKIFEGHRLLLSKVKGELFETSGGRRRRTRKHKKGKKSKKSKKGCKTRKHSRRRH